MKKIVLLTLAVISFVTISCKKEKQEEMPEEKVAVKEKFYVEVTANAAKKDDFAVYYTEDGTINFNGKNVVWHGIEASKEETIVFDLPVSVTPTNIRLDFGLNKEQESVVISKIKLGFFEKTFEIKGSDFFKFFIEEKQFKTEIDTVKGTLKLIKVGSEYKTPFFYPRQELNDKVKEMTIGNK